MALFLHRFTGTYPIGAGWGFGWWSDSTSALGAIQNAAEQWVADFFTAGVAATYDSSFTIDSVRTAEIDQSTGVQLNATEGLVSLAGSGTGVSLMADASIVTTLRTDTTARVGRGRFYLPCGLVGQVSGDGRIDSTLIGDLMSALLSAWTAYNASGTPVIYSRVDRQLRPITQFDIGDLWDTQRRREASLNQARQSLQMP